MPFIFLLKLKTEEKMRKTGVFILFVLIVFSFVFAKTLCAEENYKLTEQSVLNFSKLPLKCIKREYPNKPSHVMNGEKDILSPKQMHPAFYGCFDWHSSVHGHWMLVKLLKLFPNVKNKSIIIKSLNQNLSKENILKEVAYLNQKNRKSFERTYGWAWLLKLSEELRTWKSPSGRKWAANLKPLEDKMVERYMNFLPKLTYPIRTGVHPNTAFALSFGLDYARAVGNRKLESLIIKKARYFYLNDKNCPASWEPGGEDFFSPCLMEADLMRRVLNKTEFLIWFRGFLPDFQNSPLLKPARVEDRSDPKIVHLDGLNLSRAWCLTGIKKALPPKNNLIPIINKSINTHLNATLKYIMSGQYGGEHWLASFAIYALSGL
jgi:hypothetical protein